MATRKITIELEIDEEHLFSRRCYRCGSEDFKAIVFIPHPQHKDYNPRLSDIVEPFQVGAAESQSTFPLAICMGCKRLASLV